MLQVGCEKSMISSMKDEQVEGSKIASCSDGDDFADLFSSPLTPQETTSCFGALMNYFTTAFSRVRASDSQPAWLSGLFGINCPVLG